MLIEERSNKIQEYLNEKKSASIEELAELLQVSKDTIRRDLMKLEQKNRVKRIHGGAMLVTREALIFDYEERSNQFQGIKEKLAIKSSQLISDNSSILLDASTTVEAVIPHLNHKGILAITNSLSHAILLAQLENCEINLLPGRLHKKQLFISGAETVNKIGEYKVDYALLGVFALNQEGLFIHTEEEGLVKRQMIQQSKQVIALADHSKINTTGFFKVCELNDIDLLITDKQPNEDFSRALTENNVTLILV